MLITIGFVCLSISLVLSLSSKKAVGISATKVKMIYGSTETNSLCRRGILQNKLTNKTPKTRINDNDVYDLINFMM